jgi:hypothetical protein
VRRSGRKVGAAVRAVNVVGWCGLCALLALGCRDGGPLSMHDYARESRAVCSQANRRVARVASVSQENLRASAHTVAKIVVIRRRALSDLRALHAPGQLVDAVPRWFALVDQALDELDAMAIELGRGDRAGAVDDWRKAAILTVRARELAPPLRLSSCAFEVHALAPSGSDASVSPAL